MATICPEKDNCKILEENHEFKHKDGGWGWIVMIATGFNIGNVVGILNCYTLVYNKMVNTYEHEENHVFYAGNYFYN